VVVLFCFHRVAKLNIPPMMANMGMYCTLQNSKKNDQVPCFLMNLLAKQESKA
jgi:hypothetical protein